MSTFTVKSVMPTGKNHATYGVEFYVQFNETEQAFPLWFKQAPEVGSTVDGEITDGKFKKIKKEYTGGQNPPSTITNKLSKPAWKDNSDGMRQGMCFNNAANFVNGLVFENTLTDREWADTVFAYAQALYRKGDLNVASEGSQEEAVDELATVKDVFGPVEKVVPPRGN